MDMAREEARRGAAEGTIVIADEQTAGRGRLKRAWLSPRGSIALSLILRPPLSYLPNLIMLSSTGIVRAIKLATSLEAQIKWPNDVLINGKKVCGILIENDISAERMNHSITGVGINVNLRPDDFPEIQSIATSLSQELGKEVSRLSVLRYMLAEMEKLYLGPSDAVYQEWHDNLVTLGKRVRATSGEETYEGVAESVTRDGSLLLRSAAGCQIKVVAGDVTLRE
jgi:BirA family biotin operon repressor/biotin-[acetyl-CoA-carboxylase] ligase